MEKFVVKVDGESPQALLNYSLTLSMPAVAQYVLSLFLSFSLFLFRRSNKAIL